MSNVAFNNGNFCTTLGLLTATGSETVHDTTATIQFAIGGKAYTKTAITDGATPTTDAVSGETLALTGTTTTGECAAVVWCLDKDGNVKCLFGKKVTVDYYGTLSRQPEFPTVPNTLTPFAYQICKHYNQASTFTFGSSNWDTTGFTGTPVDILVLPNKPQTS